MTNIIFENIGRITAIIRFILKMVKNFEEFECVKICIYSNLFHEDHEVHEVKK